MADIVDRQIESIPFECELNNNKRRKGNSTYKFINEIEGPVYAVKYISFTNQSNKDHKSYGLEDLNEIDILTRIQHPYIIHAIYILTSHNYEIDGLAIILPIADRTLMDISKDSLMTTEDKLPILYKIIMGIEFLHQNNILHLNIKNTNVIIQSNSSGYTPYLIDFNSSMSVLDIHIGKYNHHELVDINFRAPEVIKGNRIYNAPVDIWSFGIMMLSTISSYSINFSDNLYETISMIFSTPHYLCALLSNVNVKYQNLCLDLLINTLQLDPLKRLTAKQICEHKVFNEFKETIEGNILIPDIDYDYNGDHRDILKLLINWVQTIYGNFSVELLFLAIDLYNRLDSFYKFHEPINRMIFASTCLWIANKLTSDIILSLDEYIPQLTIVSGITIENILNTEIEIIYISKGILNINALYKICENCNELNICFDEIIMSKDSTAYAKLDIHSWSKTMKTMTVGQKINPKNITISELIC